MNPSNMNGTNHSSYFDGGSHPSQSYKRYQQPRRDMEPSQQGHRDRHTERGHYRQQNPRNLTYYDEGTRQYVTEQAYFDRREIIEDRRGQYSPARYYDDGQRLSDEQLGYQADPYAPPKPPRGHQSKNKIYLPEEDDDRLRRNNQRNRYNNYSEKPPRSPHDSHSKRPPQHPRSVVRDHSQPGYDPQPERHSQQQSRPSRRHKSEVPPQYQSFGSEPQSQVSRPKKHVDENYNYGNARGRPDIYYPETASLDRREIKKQPQARQRQDPGRSGYPPQRMPSDPPSGYHSDRIIDERGYNPQIPDWLKASDPGRSAVPQVGYQPVSMAPKQIYRSDGELDLSEYSDSEYRVRPTEVSRRNAPLAHQAPDRHPGWKTPHSSSGYRKPLEPRGKALTPDYGSWDRYSSSQDYYRYTTDEEMFSEPERDPPPVPVSVHYATQPQHDIRRGYVQVNRSTYKESSKTYGEQQPLYDKDTNVMYRNRDTQLTSRPSDPKRQPMIEMEPEESDEPPPLRTPREIKAYDQHIKKFRNTSNPVTRATITATYQPVPTSPTSPTSPISPTSPTGTHGIPPASTRYTRPTGTTDGLLSQRQRSKSQERPFPAREFERSQSPLSEPETTTTALKKIRSRNNSAVFCIVSQTSPLASSDQGSDAEVLSGKVAPRDLPEREFAPKTSQGEQWMEPAKREQQRRDFHNSSNGNFLRSEAISKKAQNDTFSVPLASSDSPPTLGEVVEEPLVLPSATRGNVYAIRDTTENKPEDKPRNVYAEELAHQKKWNRFVNEVSEPEEVMEEPVVLPSATQGEVYAVRQTPMDTRPSRKQQSFYERELEAQAEQSRNAPEMVEGDRVVAEPLLLPSQTRGDVYATQTRPGRIRPKYEEGPVQNVQRTSYPKQSREPKDGHIKASREPVEADLPVTSSAVPSVASMPSNGGMFVDDPDGGGYQYKPLKKRSRSLDGREPSFRPNDSGDRFYPTKENPTPELVRPPRSHSLPRSGEEREDKRSSKSSSPEAQDPMSMSKGEQLFVQKRKEAEFEDMRQKILAAERVRRLKILDAKAESEPDIAVSRRNFFSNTPSTKSTPPSIELRMYSTKSKTVDYPSHKKVFQKTDRSPQRTPVKADNQKEERVRDPEPEPLVLQGVAEDLVNVTREDPLKSALFLKEHGQGEHVLDAWQIAELKRALKEYEEDVHSPRGRKKNRRERSKSDLTNMLLNALSQLEIKEREEQGKDAPTVSSSASIIKPVAVDKDRPKVPSKIQPLSKLYRPPKSNDNLGYSSDSSQDPMSQQLSRAERLTGIPGLQIPALEKKPKTPPPVEETMVKQDVKPVEEAVVKPKEEVIVQRAPLVTEETFPDDDIPLIDDDTEETDSGTEEETPPNRAENLLSPPKVGRKGSVDSVSTVDSASLTRPFEDIGNEYATMMGDHDVNKVTPVGRSKSSSVDSLIQIASWEEYREEKPGKDSPADEAYYSSSTKDGRRKRDLEITAPPTSSGRNLNRDKYRLRRDQRVKPDLEDLPEEGSMTSRSTSLGVSKLRDRYSSERPASFDSPRYSSSRTTSSKSVGALQSRFSDKTDSSSTSRLSSSGNQQRSSSIDLSHSSIKPKSIIEEKKRYGTPEKRLSSESGYGSLERDKSKELTSQKGKTRTEKNGSIGKISENGSLPTDPDFQIACAVTKTIAQRSGSESDSNETKKARMETYKEKRRRELAEKHGSSASTSLRDAPAKSRKLPKEPSAVPSLLQKKGEVSSLTDKTQKEEQQAKKNRRSFTETVKQEDTLQARRNRRVSNLSMETQQLLDALESSRAARRERLRRSETEDGDNTYRILARHRERQSSLSSDVFSPIEKDADPSDKLLDDGRKEKPEPEEESQPAVSSKKKDEDGKSSRTVSLSSQGTVEEETKDSSVSRSQSTKQSKDRRRRQNVTITAEDVKEARRMGTQLQTESSSKPSSEAKTRKAPFKWEAKVETTRRPSLENVSTDSEVSRSSPVSRRKVVASPAKVETVTISKPKTSSPKSDRYKLNNSTKSTAAERRKLLPKQASLSSTEDDSSSSAFELRRPTKPRSDSAPSSVTEGSPKRKGRVLPHTPVVETVSKVSQSESFKVRKAGGFKPSVGTSAGYHREELAKNKKDEKKTPSSPPKTLSSPSRKLPSAPQDKSLTNNTQITETTKSKESQREKRKSVEIEEEVISRHVIVKESESREIPEKSRLTKKGEILESDTHEREKKQKEMVGSGVGLKKDVEEESLVKKEKNKEDTTKDEKKPEGDPEKLEESVKGEVESKIEKKEEKKLESVIQRKSTNSKTLQEKRKRSRTAEIPRGLTESPPASPSVKRVQWRDRQGSFDSFLPGEDVKKQALETKDDELFEMMKLRAQLIKEHEMEEKAEKGVEIEDSTEDEDKQPEIPPQNIIKVSVTDRMSAFKQGDSAPLPKTLIPKTILKKPTTADVKPVTSSEKEEKVASGETGSDQQKNEEEEKEAESPDQLASLSLTDKMKLFASLSQQAQESVPSPKMRQRHPRQRSDDRSKTQPVTPEELHDIARNAREREEEEMRKIAESRRVMDVVTEEPEVEAKEDELTKMSMAEKLKLFCEKAKCADAPPPPKINRQKKKRRTGSRYTTQPITLDEVKKASGPSPLLLSFGRTVAPEVASGLSMADQIALVYQPEDVATAKPAAMVPSLAIQPQVQSKPPAEDDKMNTKMQEKLTLDLDQKDSEKLSSPQKTESPPSPSFPKSDAVDKSIKRARSLDQKELEKLRPDLDSPKKKQSTQKEIRAAVEKSRNEKLADFSSSESEVDSKMISTMDQRSDKTIIKRHVKQGTRESERYKTQPDIPDSSDIADKQKKLLHPSKSRKTQPVTPDEMAEVKHMGSSSVHKATSISERTLELKQRGENDWRKRVEKEDDTPKSSRKSDHESDSDMTTSNSSISQRMKLIEAKGESWKTRVEDKDVTQFTVEGKCKIQGKDLAVSKVGSPTPFRRVPSTRKAPDNFRVSLIEDSESESSGTTSNKPAISVSDSTSVTTSEDSEPDYQILERKIAIPKADNETFSKFYQSSTTDFLPDDQQLSAISEQKQQTFELSVSDFDALTEDVTKSKNHLSGLNRNDHRRSLRPQRRNKPSNNPLRALKTRSNILSEYTEVKMVLPEVETKPKKKEPPGKDFGNKSLAALTSKSALVEEKGKLHNVKDHRDRGGKMSQLLPYKDLMLIHIKGRKFVQVRLVEPKVSSLNSGDCFICVTPNNVFLWIGQYANVIEKAKASEVAQHIQSKKDLGCKAPSVITIEEAKLKSNGSQRNWKKMVEALGGSCDEAYGEVGANDEDQIHEIYAIDTNMVYQLQGSNLEPYGDYWATLLKFEMLKTDEIFVFDFGSELYIWQGKKSQPKQRKKAVQLAMKLYERGYDYSQYDVNPIYPQQTDAKKQSEDRPDWVLLAKTSEHMETVLFQSKFVDWPNESRLIKMKASDKEQKESLPEIVPFDAKLMIQPTTELPNVIFEGTNVGRGTGLDVVPCNNNYNAEYYDKVMRRGNKITTLSVLVWHVLEYTHSIVPKECFGQLHEGDTYVVRWQYRIEAADARSLKGEASKWKQGGGRERCAYFFWQGSKSTINEKGASALMTVELDSERGPQRQVIQGKEPAVFLHLFQGRMIVHVGKREEEETNSQGSYRLYYIKGEIETEACLVEIPCRMKMLRSRTSFVLLNLEDVEKNKASIHIWHGVKSSEASRKTARFAAERMKEFVPLEAGLKPNCEATIEEIEEGQETEFFFKAVGNDRSSYDSAIDDTFKYDFTLRLFHLTSSSGAFIANEILNTSRTDQHFTPYPCLQSDLYTVSQPALFVIDNHFEVYLWQGWWPEDKSSDDTPKVTGSWQIKWNLERKCAMETVLAYCKEKNSKKPPEAFLIHAGLEPQTFINLFPTWEMREDVAHINKKAGRRGDRAIRVRDVLQQLKRTRYTLAELKEKPEGVDPLKLETYLSDDEFKKVLTVTREEFEKLMNWKKTELKKNAGLF